MLEIKDLTVNIAALPEPILAIPHLSIPAAQQIAVMGPSGCGKSTFLNIISGLLKPTAGSVKWQQQELTALSATACDTWRFQHVGMVMQDFYLTNGLSALENVLLPLAFRHWRISDALKQRAESLLEQLNMPRRHSDVAKLSRGEMQRVAIARALLAQPQVIIADEPTASLDAENSRNIARLLLEISEKEKCTLLVATHDRFLSEQLQRRLLLQNGVIMSDQQTGAQLC
ncbi:ABC transporter ATP-binding protein [Testudinibacter sp. TR-2022]|uniref:ABC transporter ATP-binding protein n=1 Tax=Testudinibacter sp. TR-2022 TaxID=2585029 RepID=UPI00111A568A|nr:ATP-binding cassette domain-containing protein [Testudinibacter sp. TR-2022]TNH06414.1 ATP-binding cassette domain-containing protein [Pasteurellaceae bacterium Phil11]TNH22962.1 ATP-binding cassette domain-containing protein [Testudinibacter sp. TR-2022]TNH27674.1 ATP-binding cassette domain-containing protein [Testudinibacter sp. TR-2022]